jgi:hypothetical protein
MVSPRATLMARAIPKSATKAWPHDLQRVPDRELPLPHEPPAEGLALDVRHHVVQGAGGLAGIMQGEDVGVGEPGRDGDLAEEAPVPERGAKVLADDLERDQPIVPLVPGQVDRSHAAPAELTHNGVTARECVLQLGDLVNHRYPRSRG